MSEHALPSEVCDSPFEWPGSWEAIARRGPRPATRLRLWPSDAFHPGGGLGSGGLSLGGAAEGAAAVVDGLDSETIRGAAGSRGAGSAPLGPAYPASAARRKSTAPEADGPAHSYP